MIQEQQSITKSLRLLCDGFKDDMASFIYQDDQMNELLIELVSSYVEMNIPVIDEDNRTELAMMLMETIRISARQGSRLPKWHKTPGLPASILLFYIRTQAIHPMTTTMTANYKEIFSTVTAEKIDELLEDNYALDDMLEFIDNRNENDFVTFYEEYVTQGEDIGYDVVDAFIEYHGVAYVEHVRDAYRGTYDSGANFAEEYYNDVYGDVPSFLVVDWEATWEQSLSYDFDFVDGYVFDSSFQLNQISSRCAYHT